MPQKQAIGQADEANVARQEAREIRRTYPAIFKRIRVPVTDLAQALGLRVEKRPGLRQRAQLELLEHGGVRTATIVVQTGLEQNVGRFAIAHEIGHAILLRKHPEAAREWKTKRREVFASAFATELLSSPELRKTMAETFRALADPLALLRLASSMALSPYALLTLAAEERSWFQGLNKIWLRVKYVENAFTHREPKLRIVSAHYERDRFFIAPNQGLVRFAGDDRWLSSLLPGSVAHHSATITVKLKRQPPAVPKFVSEQMPAELSAVRLQPSAADQSTYLIILADLTLTPPKTRITDTPSIQEC